MGQVMPMNRSGRIDGGAAASALVSKEAVTDRAGPVARLRLVKGDDAASVSPHPLGVPVADASDPRWVLAVRTGELLQGTLLTPENRRRLSHLGRILELSSFDTNLIIAIVQDQARRGHAPSACAAAGERQLAFVPGPQARGGKGRRVATTLALVGLLIAVEAFFLHWVL